jgi:hypothetical protein
MSGALTEELVAIARAVRSAPHGQKEAIYRAAAERLGVTAGTVKRQLRDKGLLTSGRKQRADAGDTALTRAEGDSIAALLMESTRQNGKRLLSLEDAVITLRANGIITAGRVDEDTGEFFPLSISAISRALTGYGLHPDQLLEPAPVTELQSLHPNHVWEIDASLCVLYYLKRSADEKANGLRVMGAAEFYKNKPANFAKIERDRVWRYCITDHNSGGGYVEYVFGGESGENLCSVFINAIQHRGPNDPMHGVPFLPMLDPGSANTGALFLNLCRALQCPPQINAVGNPRAKGQVEKFHDIVERKFESSLKLVPVHSLEELNTKARRWNIWFNATAIHSRHGKTRNAQWLTIRPEQLRIAPPADLCRELARTAPEGRKVTPKLTISFRGLEFDVSTVPEVMVGQEVMVCRNPWRENAAQIVLRDAEGHEIIHVVDAVERNEAGFRIDAPVIGQRYKAHADTPVQKNSKRLEIIITGQTAEEEQKKARKDKVLPFGGRIDPYKHMDPAQVPHYLPKQGTALGISAPAIETPPLSIAAACKALMGRLGSAWTPDCYAEVSRRYPGGQVPEADIEGLETDFRAGQTRPKLQVVR